jgi:hypothetical protein
MNINWKNKIWKMGAAIGMAAVMVAGMVVPALAEDGDNSGSADQSLYGANIIKGKVVSVDSEASTFSVQPASGDAVIITVDSNTKYYLINADISKLPAIKAQLKDRVQQMKKDRLSNKGPNNDNLRGLGNKRAGVNNNNIGENTNETAANTTENDNAADDSASVDEETNPEDLPEMEAGLRANMEAPQGFFGKLKAFFNRGPKFGKSAGFSDLEEGVGVVVNVMPNENLAKQVLIVEASLLKNAKGNITEVTDDSFTVETDDSTALTFKWDENTLVTIKGDITLKTGQWANVVYNSETMMAKSINVRPEAPATPTPTVVTDTTEDDENTD